MNSGDLVKICLLSFISPEKYYLVSYPSKKEAMKKELSRQKITMVEIPETVVYNKDDTHNMFCFGIILENDYTNNVMRVGHTSISSPWVTSWIKTDSVIT